MGREFLPALFVDRFHWQARAGIEDQYVGSFVANSFYASGTVFKTQPGPGEAPKDSEVTAFVSTGPAPGGIVGRSPCLKVIRSLPPGVFNYIKPSP